jgi:hypothetical protein
MAPVHPGLVVLPPELTAVLRAIVPPLVAAYVVFVVMVILAWRRPGLPRPRWREKTREPVRESKGSFLATAICGYVVFLAIVLVFHVWLAGESDALVSAVWGGLFLSMTALGASAFTTLVVPLLRGRKVDGRRQARPRGG